LDQLEERLKGRKLDLVLSDMAPNLSGHPTVDAARIEYIMELAVDFAKAHLKPNGALLVKCFHGPAYNNIVTMFKVNLNLFPIRNQRRAGINRPRYSCWEKV
jgi:23S rRNA (uridine2552-2'-O)-methyltransferase